jgi:branched-chain amino acid transport system permease protein
MSGASLIQLVVSGISIGAVYGLVGLGFVTIYRASGVVNFAQGEFVMLGAMMGFNLWKKVGINYPLSCLIAVVAVSIVGLLIYQLIVVPLRGAPPVMIIMGTIGVSVLLQNVALNLWTSYPVFGPSFSGNTPIRIGSVAIESQNLWILGMAIAVVAGLYLLNNKTRVGKAMTATATEPMAAGLVGVRTGSMIRLAFVIAAAIGALAGIFVSPVLPVSFLVGSTLTLKGFVASVLGGWGKPSGALVGGIALGVVETVTGGYVQAGYKDAVAFVLLLVVLSFRPGGLLGSSLTEAEA